MPEDFYVEQVECMACGAPPEVAPDLMGFDDFGSQHIHCYFKRQPQGEEETAQAVAAVNVSCCGAVRYRGSDLSIISRIDSCAYDGPVPLSYLLGHAPLQQVPRPIISTPSPSWLERIKKALT